MEETHVCEILWMMEGDFKLMSLILRASWKHMGTFLVDDYDEDEGYVVMDCFEKEDGSSAEVYYYDEEKRDIADIRLFMAVDEDEKENLTEAFREFMRERGESYDEIPYRQYLY